VPLNPACQQFATAIVTLEATRATVRAGLGALTPIDRWKALVQIGDLDRQILDQQEQLDTCERQHQADYEAEVVALDTSGGPPVSRTARLWSMDEVPTELEDASVVGGVFQFASGLSNASVGITIEETGNPSVQGVDFRSGPLEELPRTSPADPGGRIEIVVGPALHFAERDFNRWLQGVEIPTTSIEIPTLGGRADITVSNLTVALLTGAIDVVASGTANIAGPLWGSQLAPFKLEIPISLSLPLTPDSDRGCDLLIQGSPSVTVSGPLGSVLTAITQLLVDLIAGQSLPILRKAFNRAIPPAVAAIFGLEKLPRLALISLRKFEITPTGVTIQPTIGAFGEALSTFMP
jgi:hypothetical protein